MGIIAYIGYGVSVCVCCEQPTKRGDMYCSRIFNKEYYANQMERTKNGNETKNSKQTNQTVMAIKFMKAKITNKKQPGNHKQSDQDSLHRLSSIVHRTLCHSGLARI